MDSGEQILALENYTYLLVKKLFNDNGISDTLALVIMDGVHRKFQDQAIAAMTIASITEPDQNPQKQDSTETEDLAKEIQSFYNSNTEEEMTDGNTEQAR